MSLSEEQGPEEIQSAEQPFSKGGGGVPIPSTGADTVTGAPLEGRASSEGPLLETSKRLKDLAESTSKEPIGEPNAQLIVIEKEPPIQIKTEPMLVDYAKARDPQDVSPGTDAVIKISPLEVSLVSRRVLSLLS